MSHAFLLSIDLLSAPLLYYHGCVKVAVAVDAAIDLGYALDWLLGLPSFVSLFCPTKWYALHHDTFTIFLSTVLPLAAVTMNFYQIDKLTLRGEPFTNDAHHTMGAGRFSRKPKRAKFIWLLSFIMVLMSSWALGLFAVIYTAVTQFGTDCGSSFDPLAWCRWSVRPFLGPNACDCRLVVGQTHTLNEEHGGSSCAVLPEVLDRWPRVEYLVMSPTPDVLWHCSIDDDEVDWVSQKMRFVKVLSLPYQNITRLNQSFGALTSLSLPYNFLTRLEAGVLRMNPGLEHLSVEMNNLLELPNEVFSMSRLQGLSLMGNPVCSSPEYDGALEDLASRGVSPLCGDTPWENKRNHRERTRNDDYSESPVKDEIICGASPRADPLAFAIVYYRGVCGKYKHSPSSECLAVCDEVASWISYTSDDDDGVLSLVEMNRYLQLIGIRPYSSQGEMECMVRVMDCRQVPTMPAFPPTPYTIAMMMSGGVTDCSHCPYHVR
ncbi:hypothetical protein FOZ62_001349 [Perkinsus olseni]|uniref:Uncharacterized protein n=1 Tax=Perkinsus olseni TaxID=32597 RepID=A0A7J6S809_PEROL|nr:hypothetical protein FOZ62_001349 [Perkinsus olseni]